MAKSYRRILSKLLSGVYTTHFDVITEPTFVTFLNKRNLSCIEYLVREQRGSSKFKGHCERGCELLISMLYFFIQDKF